MKMEDEDVKMQWRIRKAKLVVSPDQVAGVNRSMIVSLRP